MKLDAILLVLLAIIPSMENSFHSPTAASCIPPVTLFFITSGLAWFAAGAGALKGFRSTQFSEWMKGNASRNGAGLPPAAIAAILVFLFASTVLTGCAVVTQSARTTSTDTNGVASVTVAHSRIMAIGDARNTVDKVRASAGKTSSVGASGVDAGASATNAVSQVGELLGALVRAAAK